DCRLGTDGRRSDSVREKWILVIAEKHLGIWEGFATTLSCNDVFNRGNILNVGHTGMSFCVQTPHSGYLFVFGFEQCAQIRRGGSVKWQIDHLGTESIRLRAKRSALRRGTRLKSRRLPRDCRQ